eukprot:TRINITY_DN12434_c0_g1_i1.p1 TRINITY_DN12434_c0_g1~~TRINITY_DN12434_c0_g1_i1.p1  ORF type:complete len:208 (+),score=39.13 TRINITY_DN12434_c0_g1_i1:24-626(+)
MTSVSQTLVEFPIVTKDTFGADVNPDHLQVSVSGPQSVSASLKKKDGKTFVSFYATVTGDYTVRVTNHGENIQNSPMTVNVKVKQPGDESKIHEPPAPTRSATSTKNPVRFEVEAKDHEGNSITGTDLQVSISGPEKIEGCKVEATPGKFLFTFETTVLDGTFTVDVKYRGQPIYRSPFTITLNKATGPGNANEVARLRD